MNENEKAAYVMSQSMAALIEAMGMQAENAYKLRKGQTPPYGFSDFNELIMRYGIGCNDVIAFFQR